MGFAVDAAGPLPSLFENLFTLTSQQKLRRAEDLVPFQSLPHTLHKPKLQGLLYLPYFQPLAHTYKNDRGWHASATMFDPHLPPNTFRMNTYAK